MQVAPQRDRRGQRQRQRQQQGEGRVVGDRQHQGGHGERDEDGVPGRVAEDDGQHERHQDQHADAGDLGQALGESLLEADDVDDDQRGEQGVDQEEGGGAGEVVEAILGTAKSPLFLLQERQSASRRIGSSRRTRGEPKGYFLVTGGSAWRASSRASGSSRWSGAGARRPRRAALGLGLVNDFKEDAGSAARARKPRRTGKERRSGGVGEQGGQEHGDQHGQEPQQDVRLGAGVPGPAPRGATSAAGRPIGAGAAVSCRGSKHIPSVQFPPQPWSPAVDPLNESVLSHPPNERLAR